MKDRSLVLFDGVCNLCNRSVQFIIEKDKKKKFLFASLQGKTGQAIIKEFNLPSDDFNSFILLENNKIYTRSHAALRVCRKLSGGWKLLYGFVIVPAFARNWFYDRLAKNRYKWYGKRETCMIPEPGIKDRFLD